MLSLFRVIIGEMMKRRKIGRGVQKTFIIFLIFLILVVVIDPFVHKHTYFGFDSYPYFYGAFGFFSCVLISLIARYILRPIVMRREDYYND